MKTKRQTKMLELIKKHDIETQEELSDYRFSRKKDIR